MPTLYTPPAFLKWAFTILLASATLMSCGMDSAAGGPGENGTSAPALEELANATYAGVFDQPVALVDGRWEGAPFVEGGASRPTAGLVESFLLTGDVNDDGREDAVVLLWESSGGSGTRSYLAAMGRGDGVPVNLGTALVGDRVQVKAGFIFDGMITLDLVQAGPGEAACCPTQKALASWRLVDGALSPFESVSTGTLSLGDLEGPDWVLAAIGWDSPVPKEPSVGIHFDGDKVTGNAGCNAFFGTVTSEGPGHLAFSAMGTTMKVCPDSGVEFERRFLRTLAGGSSYSFVAARLVIGCETDDGPVALVFRRAESMAPDVENEP